MGKKGWSGKDIRDLLIFIERIINLKDLELRKEYTVYVKEMEEKQMAYESWIEKHFRDEGIAIGCEDGIAIGRKDGITIGEDRARRSIMKHLLETGMPPQQAAAITGLNV